MEKLSFLAFSDLEGRHDLIRLLGDADLSRYDCLVYKGDTPDPAVYKEIRRSLTLKGSSWSDRTATAIINNYGEAWEASVKAVEDSAKVADLLRSIRQRIPIYGVLGNSDTVPTVMAPALGLQPVDSTESMELVHNRTAEFKGFDLLGYNGRVQYIDETIVEAPQLYFAEEDAARDLAALFEQVQPETTIFITHAPPYGILDNVKEDWVSYAMGTYGESGKNGHIGSKTFRDLTSRYQPLVHTFGHVHERPGVEKHGRTTFINGGALGETEEVEEVIIEDGEVSCRWIRLADL